MKWLWNTAYKILLKLYPENTKDKWGEGTDEVFEFLRSRPEKNIAVMSKPDIEAFIVLEANKRILAANSATSWFAYPEVVFKGEAFRKRLPEFIQKFNIELIVSSHRYLTEYPLVFNNGHFQIYNSAELKENPPEFKLIKP